MTDSLSQIFDKLNKLLEDENIVVSAAELHGMIAGLMASGSRTDKREWLLLLVDLLNEGERFSPAMEQRIEALQEEIVAGLASPDLNFQLLLPGDEEPMGERLKALTDWAQAFLAGFGVNQQNLAQASDDLREAIEDMAEISRLSSDHDNDEEDERAYYEVSEYVRITAIMCFNELADVRTPSSPQNNTIH